MILKNMEAFLNFLLENPEVENKDANKNNLNKELTEKQKKALLAGANNVAGIEENFEQPKRKKAEKPTTGTIGIENLEIKDEISQEKENENYLKQKSPEKEETKRIDRGSR